MSKTNNYNSTIPTHLEDEDLIAYLDGELKKRQRIFRVSTLKSVGRVAKI